MQVFTRAGLSSPIIGSIIVGCVNVVGTGVAAYIMDKTGRRPLLIASHAGMAISLISISLAKFLPRELLLPDCVLIKDFEYTFLFKT